MALDTLLGSLGIALGINGTVSRDFSQSLRYPLSINPNYELTTGTASTFTAGTNNIGATGVNVNQMAHDQVALAGSAQEVDFTTLSNGIAAASFDKLKVLAIFNLATTAGYDLAVGGAASNAFSAIFSDATDEIVIAPGGCALFIAPGAGYTVDSSHKALKLDPGANTFNVLVVAIGVDS